MSPVRSIFVAPATAGMRRIANKESPNSARLSLAATATSGDDRRSPSRDVHRKRESKVHHENSRTAHLSANGLIVGEREVDHDWDALSLVYLRIHMVTG